MAIPAFAAWYARHPGEFYHATATRERSISHDQNELEFRIARAIEANFQKTHHKTRIEVREGLILGNDISVHLLPVDENEANLGRFAFKTGSDVTASAKLSFSTPEVSVFRLRIEGSAPVVRHPRLGFPCPAADFLGVPSESRDACLVLDAKTADLLTEYLSSVLGRPSMRSSGHFWRMFYFSAVTISTLGYGDIVPVTENARAVVTIEVVVGPVLFGLFLNSLFREGAAAIAGRNENASDGQSGAV